jgi:hypothetical protein
MKISKTAILPVVTVICLGVAAVTGHPIGKSTQDLIATDVAAVITAGVSIWGVFKNHKK